MKPRKSPRTFYSDNFPNKASHCHQEQCGFCTYHGVLVQWDEDHDERILDVLDALPAFLQELLATAQEHKARLWLQWHPGGEEAYHAWTVSSQTICLEDGSEVIFDRKGVEVSRDWWQIMPSTVEPKERYHGTP